MISQRPTTPHDNVLTVTDRDFAAQVLQAPLPVIVDFGAERCPPCRVLEPVFARLSEAYTGRVRFARVDSDAFPMLTAQLGIQAIPTLILFVDGKEAGRLVGPHPARLQRLLDELLAEK